MSGSGVAASMALVAGVLGSVQVAIMGRFGDRIGSFEALAFSTVVTAVVAGVALLLTRQSLDGFEAAIRSPAWLWLGGLCGAFIVLSVTVAGPRIGTAATIALLITGQLAMGAAIDRFGLFGLDRIPLSPTRVAGLLLLAVGTALTLRK